MRREHRFDEARASQKMTIATFDSGFGGFFTAKAIEEEAKNINRHYDVDIHVKHYGDTQNAPYGEKSPDHIARLTTSGVEHALANQSDMVFIACNTASTQYDKVRRNIEEKNPGKGERVISIIDKTVEHLSNVVKANKDQTIHIAILATPATIKSGAYPQQIAKHLGGTLVPGQLETFNQERWHKESGNEIESNKKVDTIHLHNGKCVKIYQVGPGNWVDLIEKGAGDLEKQQAVARDVRILTDLVPGNAKLAATGEFCTHYPVFNELIQENANMSGKSGPETEFILQGPIMAEEFVRRFSAIRDRIRKRLNPLPKSDIRASIAISGNNIEQTKKLANTIFPSDTETSVEKMD